MKKVVILLAIVVSGALLAPKAGARQREKARTEVLARSRGFYKDIFMDGGIGLTSRASLAASSFLGAPMEFFASAPKEQISAKDTLIQTNIFYGSEEDTNGWLLYPDGAPRFRVIYVNGGKANAHAKSLGKNGISRLQEYIAAGGSYVGTCAGAFFGSSGSINNDGELRNTNSYPNLWPGYTHSTHLKKSKTTLRLEKRSPLAAYFDFGKSRCVPNVYHNGGCYAHVDAAHPLPKESEVLARYRFDNTDKVVIDNEIAIWAHKQSPTHGRVILCGSHPESITEGKRLELMSAMLLYAMEGNPAPQIKGTLTKGEVREMNKRTEENDPAHTRIGDKQYHHFRVDVPKQCKKLIIHLDGYEDVKRFDLTLCAKRGEPAFHDNTLSKNVAKSCKKTLTVENPKSGEWYVSVFCETTVSISTGKYGTQYRGKMAVLNGVPYKIWIEYE